MAATRRAFAPSQYSHSSDNGASSALDVLSNTAFAFDAEATPMILRMHAYSACGMVCLQASYALRQCLMMASMAPLKPPGMLFPMRPPGTFYVDIPTHGSPCSAQSAGGDDHDVVHYGYDEDKDADKLCGIHGDHHSDGEGLCDHNAELLTDPSWGDLAGNGDAVARTHGAPFMLTDPHGGKMDDCDSLLTGLREGIAKVSDNYGDHDRGGSCLQHAAMIDVSGIPNQSVANDVAETYAAMTDVSGVPNQSVANDVGVAYAAMIDVSGIPSQSNGELAENAVKSQLQSPKLKMKRYSFFPLPGGARVSVRYPAGHPQASFNEKVGTVVQVPPMVPPCYRNVQLDGCSTNLIVRIDHMSSH